jgi:hypothetical protein
MPLDLSQMIAPKGFAPQAWQSSAPVETYLGRKPPISDSKDLRRIVQLPRRDPPPGAAVVAYMNPRFARVNPACRCGRPVLPNLAWSDARQGFNRECITSLREVQAWALYEIACEAGLLGPIGVGHGKTMLDLLAPLAMPDCRQALLLVPPTLLDQLWRDYWLISQHFYMPKIIIMGNKVEKCVEGPHIRAPYPVLHVMPYSKLSRHSATVFMDTLAPDTVIADECHKLAHADTATTARVLRFFDNMFKQGITVRFCGWTGSLTYKDPGDYAHLSGLALRERSPVPLDPQVVKEWCTAFDGDWPAPPGALDQLMQAGEHVYSAFHRRFVQSSGIVATTEAAIDCESRITEREAPEIPDTPSPYKDGYHGTKSVAECLRMIRDESKRPDGETLLDAFSKNRCAREMACGFYYYWFFPPQRNIVTGELEPQDEDHIKAWFAARKAWHMELRDVLKERLEHMDSPFLCSLAAARAWRDTIVTAEDDYGYMQTEPVVMGNGLPVWKADTWPAWRDIRKTVVHESRAQWVDDYLARDAADWARDHRGIVWYEHSAFGQKVAELSGLPMHGGGPGAGKRLAAETGNTSIICSIKSHGTGRDGLQFLYHDQLVANPMSNPTGWEQLLGRLLRIGQKSPHVSTEFYMHTKELRDHVQMAIKRAIYVQGTLGSPQKLLVGFRE